MGTRTEFNSFVQKCWKSLFGNYGGHGSGSRCRLRGNGACRLDHTCIPTSSDDRTSQSVVDARTTVLSAGLGWRSEGRGRACRATAASRRGRDRRCLEQNERALDASKPRALDDNTDGPTVSRLAERQIYYLLAVTRDENSTDVGYG